MFEARKKAIVRPRQNPWARPFVLFEAPVRIGTRCSSERSAEHEAEMKIPSGSPALHSSSMKILVVEDNRKLASFLSRALTEEGYTVDVVVDGITAIEQIQALPYDLVILDWMLPEMDGLSVCRELRRKGCPVPILMLTARAEVPERIAGLDAGADDYLAKPFDLGELLARVRARGRRSAFAETTVRVGPLVVDRAERRALIDGKKIDLTPREFALLAYLAREAGRVVPRTELLAKVWETSFDPGSNVVEVHVKNIRDKLGTFASLIETVRGIGYKLAPIQAP